MRRGVNFSKRFCLFVVMMLVVLLPGGCGRWIHSVSNSYTADWSSVQIPQGTFVTTSAGAGMAESDYKRRCHQVGYSDFENDLNAHKGEDVYFKGPLAFVGPAGDIPMASLRALAPGLLGSVSLVPADAPDNPQAMVWLLWPGPLPPGIPSDPEREQIVEVWGECQGAAHADSTPPNSDATNMPVVRARYMTVRTRE
jgi:hypothetical protein